MGKLSFLTAAVIVACTAGCSDGPADSAASPAAAETTPEKTATPTPVDPDARRYDCQADTSVAVLADGTARVTLPGGESHDLARVAGSDPEVYTGDSLYFTVGADAAYLSQQDGTRELACSEKGS